MERHLKDLLDVIKKYSLPLVTAADPDPPDLSEVDSSDEEQFACDVSSPISETDPQKKDTFLQGDDDCQRSGRPTESEKQAPSGCLESSDLDSTKDTCSPGHVSRWQSGSTSERKEHASNNCSEPRNRDPSSSSVDGDRQSRSLAASKEQASNSCSEPSGLKEVCCWDNEKKTSESDSSDEGELACDVSSASSESDPQEKDVSCLRSSCPTESEEQAVSSRFESSGLDSAKETCSSGQESHCQSGSPAERKEQTSSNRSEPSDRDSSSSSGNADNRQSGIPAERKELASVNSPKASNKDVSSSSVDAEDRKPGSPTERKEHAPNNCAEPSNQDSSSSSGEAGSRQSDGPAERKEQASQSCSKQRGLKKVSPQSKDEKSTNGFIPLKPHSRDSRKEISSAERAGHSQSGSSAERKEQAPNNHPEPSDQDSSSSSGIAASRQSSSPAERKEQTSNSCSKPSGLEKLSPCSKDETSTNGFIPLKPRRCDSSKAISSAERVGHSQSGCSAERKEQASNNHSEPSDQDSSSWSEEAHGRQSDSPAERKGQASNSYWEPSGLNIVDRWSKDKKTSATNGYKLGIGQLKKVLLTAMSLQRCEAELISWAQFNIHIFKNAKLSYLNELTFRNLMIAFRIPLSRVLHDKCLYSTTWCQFHSMLKKPTLNSGTGALFRQNGDPKSSARFVKNVQPLDRKLEGIQKLLIKAAMPSFVICNFSEHPGIQHKDQIPTLQEILLLCRESLIMCGQAFVAITDLRQERVLDNFNLPIHSPSPSLFPNMKSSLLFGPDYMSVLSRFMTEQILTVSAPPFTPGEEADPKNLDGQVDEKTKRSIDKLVRFVVEMGLEMDAFNMDKMESNPNFWFLGAKKSAAYKLYEEKLAKFQESFVSSSDFTDWNNSNMNPPSVPTALSPKPQGFPLAPKESLAQPLQKSSGSAVPPQKDCFIVPLTPPPRKRKKFELAVPAKSDVADEFPEVDSRTKLIVERLAKFAVTLGPGEVKAQKEMLSNPEHWFLHKPDSQAYKFFKTKYIECIEAKKICLSSSSKKEA